MARKKEHQFDFDEWISQWKLHELKYFLTKYKMTITAEKVVSLLSKKHELFGIITKAIFSLNQYMF